MLMNFSCANGHPKRSLPVAIDGHYQPLRQDLACCQVFVARASYDVCALVQNSKGD